MKNAFSFFQNRTLRNACFTAGFLALFIPSGADAQCAMCRRVAQTNYDQQKQTERKGRSLNNGILYLLSVPYIIGVVGAIAWYTNRKKS